jgi:hypothetical protein
MKSIHTGSQPHFFVLFFIPFFVESVGHTVSVSRGEVSERLIERSWKGRVGFIPTAGSNPALSGSTQLLPPGVHEFGDAADFAFAVDAGQNAVAFGQDHACARPG